MPIPVDNINMFEEKQLVYFLSHSNPCAYNTGENNFFMFTDNRYYSFLNSEFAKSKDKSESTVANLEVNTINKKFVRYESSFLAQFKSLSEFYSDISYDSAKSILASSLSYLLELKPELLKLELTTDRAIFYTFKKNDYSLYIQHFLDVDDDEDDEVTLTVFEKDSKLPSFAGNLNSMKFEISKLLSLGNPVNLKLKVNELSY